MIYVYGRTGCNACVQTRKLFDKLEIDYTYIDLATDGKLPAAADGSARTLPIVIVDENLEWCGFKYDRIKALAVVHGGGV